MLELLNEFECIVSKLNNKISINLIEHIFSYECALIDAEIALEFVPDSFRGLLAMAEALYHTASFEYSMLYYYRFD